MWYRVMMSARTFASPSADHSAAMKASTIGMLRAFRVSGLLSVTTAAGYCVS
jgi:hypothetical protein